MSFLGYPRPDGSVEHGITSWLFPRALSPSPSSDFVAGSGPSKPWTTVPAVPPMTGSVSPAS